MRRRDPMQEFGDQKYVEAQRWWLAHDLALYRYRNWMLLWMQRRRMYLRMRQRNISIGRLEYVQLQIAEAHDRMLIAGEEVRSTAHCASSSEMAGRIYHEEYEGREHHRNENEDPPEGY